MPFLLLLLFCMHAITVIQLQKKLFNETVKIIFQVPLIFGTQTEYSSTYIFVIKEILMGYI